MRAARCLAWTIALLAGVAAAQPLAAKLDTRTIAIHGERFTVEVARTPAEQFRGLGGRTHIDRDGGMLFPFGGPRLTAFVMRDCPIPIDVAFLDEDGRVISIHEMVPEPPRKPGEGELDYEERLRAYPSGLPAWFALETAGGRLRELGVHGGDRIELAPTDSASH